MTVDNGDIVVSIGSDDPHCHRCDEPLEGDETVCPQCAFAPRETGLRLAIGMVIGVVSLVMLTIVSIPLAPIVGSYLLAGAFVLLLLAGVVFLVAFLVTPARFSTVFAR